MRGGQAHGYSRLRICPCPPGPTSVERRALMDVCGFIYRSVAMPTRQAVLPLDPTLRSLSAGALLRPVYRLGRSAPALGPGQHERLALCAAPIRSALAAISN